MSFLIRADASAPDESRRLFLRNSGLVLSGAAVALLARNHALAAASQDGASDVGILNSALGAELEAIAAYQVGAESGLLKKPALDLAVTRSEEHTSELQSLAYL